MRRILGIVRRDTRAGALLSIGIGLCVLLGRTCPARADDPPPSVDPDWLSQTEAQIVASEYEFALPHLDFATAPNRVQGLRMRVTSTGVEYEPRLLSDSAYRMALRLSAYGREGALHAVPPGRVVTRGSRATIERDRVTEWISNAPSGIEQGFTLVDRPRGGRHGARPILSLSVSGDLQPVSGQDPSQLSFRDGAGRVRLHYGELHAFDARGNLVAASFDVNAGRVDIRLDDSRAEYPIVVDPIATTPAWADSGFTGNGFDGWSVSTAGDVNGDGFSDVVIGSPTHDQNSSDDGGAYIYFGSKNGLPTTGPSWAFYPGSFGANAGTTVACAGDVNGDGFDDILVGERSGGSYGYVFVFLGASGGFVKPKNSTLADWAFQCPGATGNPSVAGVGDADGDGFSDIIVGAPSQSDGPTLEAGVVYFWRGRSGFGTTFTTGTTANADLSLDGGTDVHTNGHFGFSVATAGDVNGDGLSDVIIGQPGGGPAGQGSFTIFLGTGLAAPSLDGGHLFSGPSVGSLAGYSVATAGDINGDGLSDILVGFPGYSSAGFSGGGGCWVINGSATAPYIGASLTITGGAVGDSMGICVATAGDVNGDGYADVLVGSGKFPVDITKKTPRGHAELYLGSATGLKLPAAWSHTGGLDIIGEGAMFGFSVATAGDVDGDGFSDFLVGAPAWGGSFAGQAYLFKGSANLPGQQAVWTQTGASVTEYFGWSVASAGDVNADGYSDVIVGDPLYDNGQTDEGRVLVYYGSATGLPGTPSWTYESNSAGANLGISVASAGDLNNDGYGDIIVGAHQFSGGGHSLNGAAFVWYGSSTGLPNAAPAWSALGATDNAQFGASVASAGDVNGDGFADVIVGAPLDDLGQTDEGAAYAWYGSASGLTMGAPNWTAHSGQANAQFGSSVASAGDVNGDGFGDVVVGAPLYDETIGPTTYTDAGRAYVYQGWSDGLGATPARVLNGATESGSQFGKCVADAGDVNGDGFSDLLVGQIWYTGGGPASQGRALLYEGSGSGIPATPAWTVTGGQASDAFAASVAGAGDVNGDGYSDILVSAPFYDDGMTDGGEVFLYNGGPSGPAASVTWTAKLTQNFANLGVATGAGDVNGDGFADIIAGAPGYDTPTSNAGLAEVFYGNASGTGLTAGLSRTITQQGGCTICIPPPLYAGGLDANTFFFMTAVGRTAAGRGRVTPQWEVKAKALPLNGVGIQTGSPVLTSVPGAGGSSANLRRSGDCSYADSPCHWRLRVTSRNPLFPRSPWVSLPANAPNEEDVRTVRGIVAIEDIGDPGALALASSYPNPAHTMSRVRFVLTRAGQAKLSVLDVAGRTVRTLANGEFTAGEHAVVWDGTGDRGDASPSGIYFYRLEAEGRSFSRQMVLVR